MEQKEAILLENLIRKYENLRDHNNGLTDAQRLFYHTKAIALAEYQRRIMNEQY